MFRYAIIGFGGLGKKHFSNLLTLEKERRDFCLCAICDEKSFNENMNININLGNIDISSIDFSSYGFYRDYKEMIKNEKPDFVISALPTYLHEECRLISPESVMESVKLTLCELKAAKTGKREVLD